MRVRWGNGWRHDHRASDVFYSFTSVHHLWSFGAHERIPSLGTDRTSSEIGQLRDVSSGVISHSSCEWEGISKANCKAAALFSTRKR